MKTNTNIPGRRAGGPMEPSGRLWPNGEFSIGYAPCGGAESLEGASEYAAKWDNSLGLALDSNSHTPIDQGKPRRGTKGITPYGKRLLRNCVQMLESRYMPKDMSFCTLTLPALTYEEFWNVSTNWAEITRVFYQKLARTLKRRGLPGTYAGCTELQPERTERENIPALHLHFVFVGRKRATRQWAVTPRELRDMWASVVGIYLWNEYDWRACENVQAIRKSAASYLAKYVSKGVSVEAPIRMDDTGWSLPTGWYNVSQTLRAYVIARVREHPELIDALERSCSDGSAVAYCEYLFSGVIQEMSGPGPHYFVGKLKPDAMKDLILYWRNLKISSA